MEQPQVAIQKVEVQDPLWGLGGLEARPALTRGQPERGTRFLDAQDANESLGHALLTQVVLVPSGPYRPCPADTRRAAGAGGRRTGRARPGAATIGGRSSWRSRRAVA